MKSKYFYIASICLLAVGLAFHSLGRSSFAEAHHLKVGAISAASKQGTPYVPDPKIGRLVAVGRELMTIGYPFAACGLAAMLVALMRRERGYYSIPLLLVVVDVGIVTLL